MFGESWQYVDYIECSLPDKSGQLEICKEEGITAYPTWEFQDGERLSGKLSFKTLSEHSDCNI